MSRPPGPGPGPGRVHLPLACELPPVPPGLAPGPGRWAVVGGNGPSLAAIPPGRVLDGDWIARVNNFVFERATHLGRRVDLAVLGGDPRVAPFAVETLRRCLPDYDLRAWGAHNPRVARAARRLPAPRVALGVRDAHVARALDALRARFEREPTTGTVAVLAAHGLGAERIVLAGIDLYAPGPARYAFAPGRRQRALMGDDIGTRGADDRLHDADLDRAVLAMLQGRGDVALYAAAPTPRLGDLMEPAPPREGAPVRPEPREPPADWAARAGPYPAALLALLRRGAAWRRRLGL